MVRKTIIGSGMLTAAAFLAGQLLVSHHSPLADFMRFLCFPALLLVFLLMLFVAPIGRISSRPATRNIFWGFRVTAILGIAGCLIAVFWPRSYGTLPMRQRANIRWWNLSTGSRIAYTLLPAKGPKQPYPIIYLQGGPGGSVDEGLIRMMEPLSECGYDVYLYDQIGSGWSDRLADIRSYTADRHKRDLEAIVQTIGAEKVILLGQSWGAILAALYTADNSRHVASLILTGPGPIQPVHPGLARLAPPDSLNLREPFYSKFTR